MVIRKLIGIESAAPVAARGPAYWRYRKEIAELRDEVDRRRMIAETSAGDIGYGEAVEGTPVPCDEGRDEGASSQGN